jgi:CheY-like chemotaxis protein
MLELRRILLVEDDPREVELTLEALAGCNLANEVVVARDGEQALEFLYRQGLFASGASGNPAVILLDIKMPKVDGVEVIRRLKSDGAMRTIPIVVLTSSRESRDVEDCYRLGVNAYVVKPIEFRGFVEAVRAVGVFWALINEPPPGSFKARGAAGAG